MFLLYYVLYCRYSELDEGIETENLETILETPFASRRILHHYHPGYSPFPSTFKSSLSDELPSLFADYQFTSNHIYVAVDSCGSPKCRAEPLFGSLALYGSSSGSGLTKLSENFYFDPTPDNVRENFHMYRLNQVYANEVLSCLFSLPADVAIFQKSQPSLHLVFYVYKITTADADTMLGTYMRGSSSPNKSALVEASNRLSQFQSPIAFGLCKLNEETENLLRKGGGSMSLKTYPLRGALSDAALLQYMSSPVPMAETPTDIEIKFNLHLAGKEDEVLSALLMLKT